MLDAEAIAARLTAARDEVRRLEGELLDADALDPKLVELVASVREVLQAGAGQWWTKPALTLGRLIPRDVAKASVEGADQVANAVGQIKYGMF